MAQPVKRNREKVATIDYANVTDGIYLNETSYGLVHKLDCQVAKDSSVCEYFYKGRLHKGEIKILCGKNMDVPIPELEGFNHGFTLEGEAKNIFVVENCLDVYSNGEKRTFNYTKADSKLMFVGDKKKEYSFFIRIYDNCYGNNNFRWVVIYAE